MKTVLLADDNEDIIELVGLVLANSGYRFITASDGGKTVEMCLQQSPDLVLMDLNMPSMNGFEAAKALRARGFQKPIVVLTGSESEEDRQKAERAGCNDYVVKTLEMRDVEQIIDRYLREAGGLS